MLESDLRVVIKINFANECLFNNGKMLYSVSKCIQYAKLISISSNPLE